ncbi:MAG: peptidylprolyl isomerase [Anaerohalosphaeraceae bacterium]
MKKLFVFVSIAIVAIALGGCQKEAEMTDAQEVITEESAADVEDIQAEEEPEAVAEQSPASTEEGVVEEVVVQEEETVAVEQPAAEPETPVAIEEVVEEIDLEAVVVTVNGQEVIEEEVSEEVTKIVEMQKKRMPPGMEMPETMNQQIRNRVVDTKVEQVLLDQEMEKNDLTLSDDQILEEIKKIAGQRDQSMEDVEAEVAKMGMTLDDLKVQIGIQMKQKILMESLNPDAVVTEADAKKFYDENPQHFVQKDQVKASHILCGKRCIKEDEYPAELEKIEAAKARLDAGEAFEEVAKDVSTCPSSAKGGDLGFFGKGQMDPAFEKAAFELEVGQTTGVVKTSFGYHLIKLTDKKEAETKSFEESEEQITQFLTRQKQQGFWAEYSKTMRDGATIEYSEKEQAARDEMEKAAAARAAQQAAPRPIQPAPAPQPAEVK